LPVRLDHKTLLRTEEVLSAAFQAGPSNIQVKPFLGDRSEEDPPVPIPNTEVKLLSPDGTAQATVWESRKSPGLIQKPRENGAFLLCAEHVRQLEGESPFDNLMEVKS
jgi:hypothetical protein